eukprot:2053849-Rhodomonas_salina.5
MDFCVLQSQGREEAMLRKGRVIGGYRGGWLRVLNFRELASARERGVSARLLRAQVANSAISAQALVLCE